MTRYFLSLGSNIEPERHMDACLAALQKQFHVLKVSSFYETDPIGPAGDQPFWNAVVWVESDDTPDSLTAKLREIEFSLGRRRESGNRFAPRTIDIDLLPQPEYQEQGFIIIPLAEIAPEETDPLSGKSFRELAAAHGSQEGVRRVKIPLPPRENH